MPAQLNRFFLQLTRILLLLTAATPLIVAPALFFPYVFGKGLFFRVLIELAVISFSLFFITSGNTQAIQEVKSKCKQASKSPIFILIGLFILSFFISSIVAVDPYSAFWDNPERMEGFFGVFHYFLFFVLILSTFERQDWMKYFKFSMVVAFVLVFFAATQYFEIATLPFLLLQSRPGSLLGNPTYIGTQMIFIFGLSAIVFLDSQRKSCWRYFSVVMAAIAIFGLFISQTRGAIVGLAAGFVIFFLRLIFLNRTSKTFKKVCIATLTVIILFGGIFVSTHDAKIWKSMPGFSRLAAINKEDPTTKTRLISLGIAAEAFKERPLFGWGPENYSVAFNKHFNPEYLAYEEAWFDRAHNKIADLFVMQGAFGGLLYLALFGTIFYALFRKAKAGEENAHFHYLVPQIVVGMLVAYFVQNLFLFDQINSYILFFLIVGFVVFLQNKEETAPQYHVKVFKFLPYLIILVSAFSLYQYNYIPYYGAVVFGESMKSQNPQITYQNSEKFLYPPSYIQGVLRDNYLRHFVTKGLIADNKLTLFTDKAIASVEELIKDHPYNPRYQIHLMQAYQVKAKTDPSYFKRAEELAIQALALAPKRLEIYYYLADIYQGLGRREEAIQTLSKAVELAPTVPRAHLMKGLFISLIDSGKYREQGEREIQLSLVKGMLLYQSDILNLRLVLASNLVHYTSLKDKNGVVRNLLLLKKVYPKQSKDWDHLLNLVKQDNWTAFSEAINLKK